MLNPSAPCWHTALLESVSDRFGSLEDCDALWSDIQGWMRSDDDQARFARRDGLTALIGMKVHQEELGIRKGGLVSSKLNTLALSTIFANVCCNPSAFPL